MRVTAVDVMMMQLEATKHTGEARPERDPKQLGLLGDRAEMRGHIFARSSRGTTHEGPSSSSTKHVDRCESWLIRILYRYSSYRSCPKALCIGTPLKQLQKLSKKGSLYRQSEQLARAETSHCKDSLKVCTLIFRSSGLRSRRR